MPTAQKVKRAPVFLIHGENEFLVSAKARDIVNELVPRDQQTLGLRIIEGKANNVAEALSILNQCLEAVRTFGFLRGMVVWLRGATFFGQDPIAKSTGVQESVNTLASTITTGMPQGHTLIVTASAVDEKSIFAKTCRNSGNVICFDVPKPSQRDKDAIPYANAAFLKHGLRATKDIIAAFVEKVGTDTRQLEQEINKLSVYLGTRKDVGADDLEAIVSISRETFAWNLQDAVGTRDVARSLKILSRLLFQNEDPIGLVMCLENRFRHLLIFREALDNRWIRINAGRNNYSALVKGAIPESMERLLSQALTSDKGKMTPYVQGKLATDANAFTYEELVNCRQLILETRRALVSSTAPGSILLQLLIIKLCRRRRNSLTKARNH